MWNPVSFKLSRSDVEGVLFEYRERIINDDGLSIEDYAADLWGAIDQEGIEKAACLWADDLHEAQQAAFNRLYDALVKLEALEPDDDETPLTAPYERLNQPATSAVHV